jgi:hypothetical protein
MFKFCKGSIALVGASCSGKTVMLLEMIKHNLFEYKVKNVLCCYLVHQPIYDEMVDYVPNFVLHQGLPQKAFVDEFLDENEGHTLIIFDDLGHVLGSNPDIASYFSVGTHHRNFTLVIMLQQLYFKGVHSKLIQLNTSYLVLFRQLRDVSQVGILSRQMYPSNWKEFIKIYEDATSEPYGYLIVNTHPQSDPNLRLLTKIFPHERTIAYKLKNL